MIFYIWTESWSSPIRRAMHTFSIKWRKSKEKKTSNKWNNNEKLCAIICHKHTHPRHLQAHTRKSCTIECAIAHLRWVYAWGTLANNQKPTTTSWEIFLWKCAITETGTTEIEIDGATHYLWDRKRNGYRFTCGTWISIGCDCVDI